MNTTVRLFWTKVRNLMLKTTFRPRFNIILLLTGLLCFWGLQAMAQPGPLDTELTNPPPFIAELVETTELTQEQVEQMRSDGAGWGNIMIAARLAERIAADSVGSDEVLTFDKALDKVLDTRVEGKGFGQIANENDLKLGRVVGKGNKIATAASDAPETGEAGAGPYGSIERSRAKEKKQKQSTFTRLIRFMGFGEKEKFEKLPKPEKPERPERPEKPEKLEKPERPERLEKPERPERPEKPEKPEKPERGPGK